MSTDSGLITVNSAVYIPPPPPTGKYLPEQPYLFQPIGAQADYPRIAGATATLNREVVGPTRDYVSAAVSASGVNWKWVNRNGDWIGPGPTYTPQSPTGWSSVATPALGSSASAVYQIDMTAMAQYCWNNSTWMAFRVDCGNPRSVSAALGTQPPTLTYVYADGQTETLPIWLMASLGGTLIPATKTAAISLPGCMEFKRPSKPVVSATLDFLVTAHHTGASTIKVNLLIPPRNTDSVQLGVAQGAALDASLPTDPSVIGVHRYVDGWNIPSFIQPGTWNYNSDNTYDPALWGGVHDASKLPNVGVGKFLGSTWTQSGSKYQFIDNLGHPTAEWEAVNSDYSGELFTPVAPGMGALRLKMYKGRDILTGEPLADGSRVGSTGSGAAGAVIPLPPDKFCTLQEIYTRYYILIGTPDGQPYRALHADRFNVYKNSAAGSTVGGGWVDRGGKMGLTPVHATAFGGLSGSAGGGNGWQMRHAWAELDEEFGGPLEGGWRCGIHTFDFQNANPAGYNFGAESPTDASFAQRGGLGGMFYA